MAEAWDVIIVGAGPAGCSTALHLVQRDPVWAGRILVLEKAHHPRPKLCGGGLTNYGEAVLRDLGLQLAVPHVALRKAYIRFQDLSWTLWGDPVFRVTRRDAFDAWLAGEVRARGVTLHEGEAVTDVERRADGITVVTSTATYQARVLVAADGSKGIVRRRLGIEDGSRVARLLEILTPEDPTRWPEFGLGHPSDGPYAVFDYSPILDHVQGYYWDFPCYVQGQAHMNRGVYDARVHTDAPRAALKEAFQAMLARRHIALEAHELMGHPIRWFNPRAVFSLPRVLFVGDAAGADPLMGEGIAYALAYGQIAAGAIADAFARADFSFGDYRQRILAHPLGRSLRRRALIANLVYRIHNVHLLRLGWRLGRIVTRLGLGYVNSAAHFHFR